MEIPYQQLSSEALRGIIEEFITREGTEYGEREISLEAKVKQVYRQLEHAEVVIDFDEETQTCTLQRTEDKGKG